MDASTLEAVERRIAQLTTIDPVGTDPNGVDNQLSVVEFVKQSRMSSKSAFNCNSHLLTIKICRDYLKKNPSNPHVLATLDAFLQMSCDWINYEDRMKKMSDQIDKNLRDNLPPPVIRHSAANLFPLSLQQRLNVAACYSNLKLPKTPTIEYQLSGERLRIGYICTGGQAFPLLGKRCQLDLNRFEVFYYNCSLGGFTEVDGQPTNRHTVDLTTFYSEVAAGKRIAADGIQILVNLDESVESCEKIDILLSLRPAPIQVTCRAERGTTGASYIDYIITDKIASPLEFAYGYSEKLAYMPNGMMVCDRLEYLLLPQDSLKEKLKLRRRFHLPESAFVFGVKSVAFQIDPDTFGCWCEILRRVPGSVVWFLRPLEETSHPNLIKEAKKRKINPRRLIFTDQSIFTDRTLKGFENLIRMDDLVDIFLDTPMYNDYHLIESICRGIPTVTLPMETLPSRLTASMLTSISCEELIAKSTWDYVEIAVNLGNTHDRLKEMRSKMSEILPDSNLFRVDQYMIDLGNLYEKMWKLKEMGEKPEHLT